MTRNLQLILITVAVLAAVISGYFLLKPETVTEELPANAEPDAEAVDIAPTSTVAVIGRSVEGRSIQAYTFGTGDNKILFVGGVHGGYEWNSVALAYEFIDYFTKNHFLIPTDITLAIIPNLNPDAVFAVTAKEGRVGIGDVYASEADLANARFNANDVDLNRNFDCKWAPESTWRGQSVSAGSEPFSEPETAALRDYVVAFEPDAAVFWHSQANTVYASECDNGIIPETLVLMEEYASAATYNTQASFDAYAITGDAEGWLASIGIPAITVELESHDALDWNRNLRGVTALLNHYGTNLAR